MSSLSVFGQFKNLCQSHIQLLDLVDLGSWPAKHAVLASVGHYQCKQAAG